MGHATVRVRRRVRAALQRFDPACPARSGNFAGEPTKPRGFARLGRGAPVYERLGGTIAAAVPRDRSVRKRCGALLRIKADAASLPRRAPDNQNTRCGLANFVGTGYQRADRTRRRGCRSGLCTASPCAILTGACRTWHTPARPLPRGACRSIIRQAAGDF
jgi:hypothetical protein